MKNYKVMRTHLKAGPKRAHYRKLVRGRVVGLPFVKERLDCLEMSDEVRGDRVEFDVDDDDLEDPEPFASFS